MEGLAKSAEHTKNTQYVYEDHLSLIQIEATKETKQSYAALQRALPRIRRTIRGTDKVFFLGRTCAVVLPATPIAGAQVVAKRLSELLVDVEYTTHILYGATAQTALYCLRAMRGAVELQVDGTLIEDGMRDGPGYPGPDSSGYSDPPTSLPHLAFLTHYPALRLFHLFPYVLARRYRCVPIGAERRGLTVATYQHLEPTVIAHMQEETRRAIFQVYCEMNIIDDVLRYWERMLPVMIGTDL